MSSSPQRRFRRVERSAAQNHFSRVEVGVPAFSGAVLLKVRRGA